MWAWWGNGRFSLTECPRHRHFQPLVQYVMRNPSSASSYEQCTSDIIHTAYQQNQRLFVSCTDKVSVRKNV